MKLEPLYTLTEIWEMLPERIERGLPLDFNAFRNQVSYLVRRGQIPRPSRVPRTDGKPGTIGMYSQTSVERLIEILPQRAERGLARETIPKVRDGEGGAQRQFSVSFWLPEALAETVENLALSGFPLSRQLLIGSELFYQLPAEAREALVEVLPRLYDEVPQRKGDDTRWRYGCSLALATTLLDRLPNLAFELGVKREDLLQLSEWRFEFTVIEGQIRIVSVARKDGSGQWVTKEVRNG